MKEITFKSKSEKSLSLLPSPKQAKKVICLVLICLAVASLAVGYAG